MAENSGEFYVKVTTHPVAAKTVSSDTDSRPFSPESPKVAVDTLKNGEKGDGSVIVSSDAGRAIENSTIGKKVVWGGDLPGDIYGDVDFKGTRNQTFRLEHPPESYDNHWRINGLSEYIPQMLEREKQVSVFLRENGLPTTNTRSITKIDDSTELPDRKGHYFPLKKWKEFALNNLKTSLLKTNNTNVEQQVDSASNWLSNTEFILETRDMQVAERIRSLAHCKTETEFRQMIEPVFKWLNTATQSRNSGLISGNEKPAPFEYTEADIKRYFLQWLPEQMGTYLGRMHKLNLNHRNLTAHNWSLVGTVYDLDTVIGEPLGDKLEGRSYVATDIGDTISALKELMRPFGRKNYLSSIFNEDDLFNTQANFIKSYEVEKYGQRNRFTWPRKFIKVQSYDPNTKKWSRQVIPDEIWEKFATVGIASKP